jgi:hypothetical protein
MGSNNMYLTARSQLTIAVLYSCNCLPGIDARQWIPDTKQKMTEQTRQKSCSGVISSSILTTLADSQQN